MPSQEDSPGWVKFTILTSDLTTVYFQDSVTYPFHYDFATNELAPFLGTTPSEFDETSNLRLFCATPARRPEASLAHRSRELHRLPHASVR